jgi:hypothetical protein
LVYVIVLSNLRSIEKKTLEKIEGAKKYGQSREIGNIGYTGYRTQDTGYRTKTNKTTQNKKHKKPTEN